MVNKEMKFLDNGDIRYEIVDASARSNIQTINTVLDTKADTSNVTALDTRVTTVEGALYAVSVDVEGGYWAIANGTPTSNATRCRSKTFIPKSYALTVSTIYMFLLAYNKNTEAYVGTWNGSDFVTSYNFSTMSKRFFDISDFSRKYPDYVFKIDFFANTSDPLDVSTVLSYLTIKDNIENKQNKTCNNLIGNDFGTLYPVSLKSGMYLTFSTSDGAAIGGSKQTNIGFYDEYGNYIDYYGFPSPLANRTIGPLSDEIGSAKYLGLLNNPPRVPLMVNIGNNILPYEEYFEDLPTVTKTLLDVVENVQDLNDLVGGVVEIKDLLSQSKYVYAPTDSGVGTEKVLTLMHITDMHGNRAGMDYALALYNKYSDSIDDIIHTGDTVTANLSNGITNWINSGCAEKVLNVIGNHDTEENFVLQAAGKDNVYNTIFAPYISGWNVTQPTGVDDSESHDYHALYYYKDYAEAKVRLIVCDTNFWDNAQKTWLTSTLAGAKTLDYAVVLACHDVKKLTELTTANFSSYNGEGINEGNSYANQPDNWLDPVKDFMDDGGHFVCILCGHAHNGHMGYMTYYPDIFVYSAQKSSMNRVSGTARILGESNQNTVSIVTINPTEKLFKLFAIGAQVDGHLRQRHVFCYNYDTKTIISQW